MPEFASLFNIALTVYNGSSETNLDHGYDNRIERWYYPSGKTLVSISSHLQSFIADSFKGIIYWEQSEITRSIMFLHDPLPHIT